MKTLTSPRSASRLDRIAARQRRLLVTDLLLWALLVSALAGTLLAAG